MSDRMTNVEIEDILSSIRRLVSEDLRPTPPRPAPPRLILTPEFRVSPSAVTASPPAVTPVDTAQGHADPVVDAEEESNPPLEARIAELEAMLSRQASDFEADEGEYFGSDPTHFAWPPASDVEEDYWASAAPRHQPVDHSSAPALDWENDVSATPSPDTTAPVSGQGSLDGPVLFDDPADVIDEEALRDIVRDIVREVLRDELQGRMGERITRNVRKLVRAEINRALVSRDYD